MTSKTLVLVGTLAGALTGAATSFFVARAAALQRKPPAPAAEAAPSPAEQQRRNLDAFARAAADPSWSQPAGKAIRGYFAAIAKQGSTAKLLGVDCRSRACVVDLQWDDLERAQEDSGRIAQVYTPALAGCTAEVYLPPSPSTPYRAQLTITGCP